MPGQITHWLVVTKTDGVALTSKSVTRLLLTSLLLWVVFAFSSFAHSDDSIISADAISLDTVTHSSEQSVNAIINVPSISSRVLGGDDSEPGEWPSVVALVRSGTFPLENRLFCGGTIVADRWVMTAAHCLFDVFDNEIRPSSIRVVAGITDLRNDIPNEETIVTSIVVHPQYKHSTDQIISYDIALLELGSSLDLPAVTLFTEDSEDYTGTLGFIAGWGAILYIDENNAVFPSKLQDATVPLVSNDVCNAPQSYDGAVADNQLCAGYAEGGVDTCAGDSGGPLFILQNGQQLQVGITGFGSGCALPLFYGIYTNVSHFVPWLSNYIQVPFQSPELIAERQAAELVDSSSDRGKFFGASLHPFVLLLLSFIPLRGRLGSRCGRVFEQSVPETMNGAVSRAARRTANRKASRAASRTASRTASRAVNQTVFSSLVGLMLASVLASCAIANSPKGSEISLANDGARVGLRTERLGDDYDRVLTRLKAYYPDLPDCVSSTAALRGAGRLSMQVVCTATPSSPQYLAELSIQTVDYLFLDDHLVRIEVTMESESPASLTNTLSSRYRQLEMSPKALEWRSDGSFEDHVRLFTVPKEVADDTTALRLQFIDGRLEDRMPSLFKSF